MRAAWLHSGCGSRELRGDSVEDERLSFTSRDSFLKQRRCLGERLNGQRPRPPSLTQPPTSAPRFTPLAAGRTPGHRTRANG